MTRQNTTLRWANTLRPVEACSGWGEGDLIIRKWTKNQSKCEAFPRGVLSDHTIRSIQRWFLNIFYFVLMQHLLLDVILIGQAQNSKHYRYIHEVIRPNIMAFY